MKIASSNSSKFSTKTANISLNIFDEILLDGTREVQFSLFWGRPHEIERYDVRKLKDTKHVFDCLNQIF